MFVIVGEAKYRLQIIKLTIESLYNTSIGCYGRMCVVTCTIMFRLLFDPSLNFHLNLNQNQAYSII